MTEKTATDTDNTTTDTDAAHSSKRSRAARTIALHALGITRALTATLGTIALVTFLANDLDATGDTRTIWLGLFTILGFWALYDLAGQATTPLANRINRTPGGQR